VLAGRDGLSVLMVRIHGLSNQAQSEKSGIPLQNLLALKKLHPDAGSVRLSHSKSQVEGSSPSLRLIYLCGDSSVVERVNGRAQYLLQGFFIQVPESFVYLTP
jgi:hypothetical protein